MPTPSGRCTGTLSGTIWTGVRPTGSKGFSLQRERPFIASRPVCSPLLIVDILLLVTTQPAYPDARAAVADLRDELTDHKSLA